MNDNRNYNPWDAPYQSASQIQQPARIGDCIGFTNSSNNINYYDPYSNYRDYYGYNMYNSYFNPYEIQRRREEEERQRRQAEINQMRLQDQLERSYYTYLGIEVHKDSPEERLAQAEREYQFIKDYHQLMQDHQQFQFQSDFRFIGDEPEEYVQANPQPEEHVDVREWIDNMGYEYAQILRKEILEKSKDLTNGYNSDNYNRMLQNFNTNSAIDALSRDFTIDDMEISLPDKFNKEYQERRKRFMDALLL